MKKDNTAHDRAMNNFYDVCSCTNDNLQVVALLIQIHRLVECSNKIVKDLENLKVEKYNKELDSILDMKHSTIQEISHIMHTAVTDGR